METRTCTKCHKTKSTDEFYRRNGKQKPSKYFFSHCKECSKKAWGEYRKNHPQKWSEARNRSRKKALAKAIHKMREEIFSVLGSTCKNCGFEDERALCIGHVNNDGAEERRKFRGPYAYLKNILKNIDSGRYVRQCSNCNAIQEFERNNR